jgi:hypothetical protein
VNEECSTTETSAQISRASPDYLVVARRELARYLCAFYCRDPDSFK